MDPDHRRTITHRSIPGDARMPVLGYPSVTAAVAWLTGAFGFTLRWQVGEHRAQLGVGPTAAISVVQNDSATSATGRCSFVERIGRRAQGFPALP